MSAVWKKTLNYLGLVEDDEEFVEELPDVEPTPVRRMRPQPVRDVPSGAEGVVRTAAAPRAAAARGGGAPGSPRRAMSARRGRSTSPSRNGSTKPARSRTASKRARPSS